MGVAPPNRARECRFLSGGNGTYALGDPALGGCCWQRRSVLDLGLGLDEESTSQFQDLGIAGAIPEDQSGAWTRRSRSKRSGSCVANSQ